MTFIECIDEVVVTFTATAALIVGIKLLFYPFIRMRRKQRKKILLKLRAELKKILDTTYNSMAD